MTEQLTFTAGQHYTTRDGRQARVYATDGIQQRIHGATKDPEGWVLYEWNSDGSSYNYEPHADDLIFPWIPKPEVNWAAMPAWAEWVAMDENGSWFTYSAEPSGSKITWSGGDFCTRIPEPYYPTFSGAWRDSKVQRPQA